MDFLNPDDGVRLGPVRIRVQAPDPYAGLKGADYIKARGLSPRPNRSAAEACAHCAQMELLPAVQQILASYKPQRLHQPIPPTIGNVVTMRKIRGMNFIIMPSPDAYLPEDQCYRRFWPVDLSGRKA